MSLSNKIINLFCKKFGVIAKKDDEFTYFYPDDIVTYCINSRTVQDKFFIDFCYECGLPPKINSFMASLMHEIGHSQTSEELNDADWDYIDERVKTIRACYDLNRYLPNRLYFCLPNEKMATKWAIDYIQTHYRMILFYQTIFKALGIS